MDTFPVLNMEFIHTVNIQSQESKGLLQPPEKEKKKSQDCKEK